MDFNFMENEKAVALAIFNLQERGKMFVAIITPCFRR